MQESPPPTKLDFADKNELIECWHSLDTQFRKPKAHVIVEFVTPEAYTRCVCVVCVALLYDASPHVQ